ncbi:MAG: hypothetical protein AB9836_07535 [Aminipila sp.]
MNISNILNLFKYDPATQGALTFNIEQALNQNWDKIVALLGKVLMSYDERITYAENDLCTSGGKVYQSKASSNTGNAVTNTTYWKDLNNATDTAITALNEALSQEIINRQNEDTKKLPLTGGVLSGDVSINKASPALFVTDTTTPSKGHIKQSGGLTYISNIKPSGTDYSQLILGSIDNALNDAVRLYRTNYGTANLYGTHNITVSTTAPSSALPNGAMHNVY